MRVLWLLCGPCHSRFLFVHAAAEFQTKYVLASPDRHRLNHGIKPFFFFFFFLLVSVFILIWSGGMNGDEVFPITHSVSKKKTDLKVKDTAIFKVFLCVCVMTGVL